MKSSTKPDIRIKRVYEHPAAEDGFRVLVDRLWPRGMSHERAQLDAWMKSAAPSTELRKWWGHNPETMEEFSARYQDELDAGTGPQELLKAAGDSKVITLVYAAHDPKVNHALILKDYLDHLINN